MEQKSFNIVGLAVALLVVVVAVTIAIVLSSANRRMGHPLTVSKQLRGIHQGLVVYANMNLNWYPGIDSKGDNRMIDVEQRFYLLIEGDFITPEYAIHPDEINVRTVWDDQDTPVTSENYSYAMLQIPDKGWRRSEWRQTINSQAIILSDRNIGTETSPASIHVGKGESWKGSVLWNDNHVSVQVEDGFETKYGGGQLIEKDRLFQAEGPDDALLVHSGN